LKLTIPAYVRGLHPEVEQLMHKFGNCRRRAYVMKQKDIDRLSIIRQLREEVGIPARYVSAAYDTLASDLREALSGFILLSTGNTSPPGPP